SPRQECRSVPQIPAWVILTTMAPGSGSGTSNSLISNGARGPLKMTARPFITASQAAGPVGDASPKPFEATLRGTGKSCNLRLQQPHSLGPHRRCFYALNGP